MKTNLRKFAVICVKGRRQKAGFLIKPEKLQNHSKKEKERSKRKSEKKERRRREKKQWLHS